MKKFANKTTELPVYVWILDFIFVILYVIFITSASPGYEKIISIINLSIILFINVAMLIYKNYRVARIATFFIYCALMKTISISGFYDTKFGLMLVICLAAIFFLQMAFWGWYGEKDRSKSELKIELKKNLTSVFIIFSLFLVAVNFFG